MIHNKIKIKIKNPLVPPGYLAMPLDNKESSSFVHGTYCSSFGFVFELEAEEENILNENPPSYPFLL